MSPRVRERIALALLRGSALAAVAALAFVVGTIAVRGAGAMGPAFLLTGPLDLGRAGGILPTILGTFALCALSLAFAAPLGIGTAIFLAEYTEPGRLTAAIRFGADCLAGVPSILFGLFGFVFFVMKLGLGWCLLSGAATLALMVLPTIVRTAEVALRAVPKELREASLALGETRWRTILLVVLPEAAPGILTGIMLALSRAAGETAAVIFTAGSALAAPDSLFASTRTMAVHFYLLAREGISPANAYGTALALVALILLVNVAAYTIMHRVTGARS